MKDTLLLTGLVVDLFVPSSIQCGVYVIIDAQKRVLYVGRSDTNLQRRIKDHIGEKLDYHSFYYEETSSEKDAYEKECILWHKYNPRDNKIHPDHPDYSPHWKCPLVGCLKHYML